MNIELVFHKQDNNTPLRVRVEVGGGAVKKITLPIWSGKPWKKTGPVRCEIQPSVKTREGIEAPLAMIASFLERYFSGDPSEIPEIWDSNELSPFALATYIEASKIPYGETRAYRDVAVNLHGPEYARAVGTALGKNPFPLLVPCHRVVRGDGDLGGYRYGREWKEWLIEHEQNAQRKEV